MAGVVTGTPGYRAQSKKAAWLRRKSAHMGQDEEKGEVEARWGRLYMER